MQKLADVLWKIITRRRVAPEGLRRCLVRTRRATECEIDAARVERLQRAELLGDDERRMVREHDAARSDPNRLRSGTDVRDDHGRCRARDAPDRMVLGDPEAAVAPGFRVPGKVE